MSTCLSSEMAQLARINNIVEWLVLGTRTEIKNINTVSGVEDAIRAERDRQIGILEAGGQVEGETRSWSWTDPGVTKRLRGKEGEVDYRYMPDPDLRPVHIGADLIEHLTTNPSTFS